MDREEVRQLVDRLGVDPVAAASRLSLCETISQTLGRLGRLLWVVGDIIGNDRKTGASPFGFGDDRTVGVATVAQIGGALSDAVVSLLKAGNLYAASALIRQLVEVEYLAHAFANDHEVAAGWLRANREARLAFWTPGAVRKRAGGYFLASDYWGHCDLGGHPTTEGMNLLPGLIHLSVTVLWADLAGHLARTWENIVLSAQQRIGDIPADWEVPDLAATIDDWRANDKFWQTIQCLSAVLREEREAEARGRRDQS